jgi:hypothetical protein
MQAKAQTAASGLIKLTIIQKKGFILRVVQEGPKLPHNLNMYFLRVESKVLIQLVNL